MFDQESVIAMLIVLVLLAALGGWGLFTWNKTRYTLAQAALYFINTLFTRVLWRTTLSGPLSVPPGQGAVIVCNHSSGIDPLLIQLTTDRVVHWMVAREYISHPAMAWAFRMLKSIPVNRGGIDTAATRQAIRLVREGGLVGLFPEARVNLTNELLLPGRPGAAMIALRAKAPVIPCYVSDAPYDGTALGSFLMTAKAHVEVGQPIDLSPYYGREKESGVLQDLTRRFLIEIARLAGVENYEPKLAGKKWPTGEESEAAVG